MELRSSIYRIATHNLLISVTDNCKSWDNVAWHYTPFLLDSSGNAAGIGVSPTISLYVEKGRTAINEQAKAIFTEQPAEEGNLWLKVYQSQEGELIFSIQQPYTNEPNGWLFMSHDLKSGRLLIDEENPAIEQWKADATLTSGTMLCFMLGTVDKATLMAHASCVMKNGKAYLFIAKSGTGKSTHSRMWTESIPGTTLLNDDHPIVKIEDDGKVIAYGSPWSGKTHCYINEQAEIGSIVRIKRAPHNKIRKLQPIEAYASLMTSFSGLTWLPELADQRHKTLERIVMGTDCHELECLPNHEAAEICYKATAIR